MRSNTMDDAEARLRGRPVVGDERPVLTAYCVNRSLALPVVPAARERAWMEATDRHFANRCLPLLIANQAGWFLLSGHTVRVTWTGGQGASALRVELLAGDAPCPAISHFGHGIVTWHVPYLFRTPPGFNLLVRGPPNWPKDGIAPLEGIVEADWSDATFTMNWQMTRRRRAVTFEAGEPIAMLLPQRRGELEAFHPEYRDISSDPDVQASYDLWAEDRAWFNELLHRPGSAEQQRGWQKQYFQGVRADGNPGTAAHQTKLALRPFIDGAARADDVALPRTR
jgi:hypothetical protein